MDEPVVIAMGMPAAIEQVGGKAATLAKLHDAGFDVPPWVVVTPAAFYMSLSKDQRRIVDAAEDHDTIEKVVRDIAMNPTARQHLTAALDAAGLADRLVAVRSSGIDEDGSDHSFAGQFESYLAVPAEQIPQRVADVWRSGFSPRVLAYRLEQGLNAAPTPPAVLVQAFVNASASGVSGVSGASGVAFGADPVSGRRSIAVVSAVPGLGTSLVGGDADADTWRIDRDGTIVERKIVTKSTQHIPDPESPTGVRHSPVPTHQRDLPTLGDSQVNLIADLVRHTGRYFNSPQDIEWVFDGDELLLVQSRPVTSLRTMPDPDGRLQLWDNSNIAESYSGITTPLTFSFARRAYEGVYRQFCLLLRVPRGTVQAHADTFANMLGLIRGRVYYNLLNWYRMLSLLPGFAANRRFMEQMMGVSRSLPEEMLSEFAPADAKAKRRDKLRLIRIVFALAREHLQLQRSIDAFYRRLTEALHEPDPPLKSMRLDELAEQYMNLERSLITRWDAPLVNDFLAMIFFGVLGKLTAKWGGDQGGQLHNHLLCAEGGIISAEPARRIAAMAAAARQDTLLVDKLCGADADDALVAMASHRELQRQFDAYLAKFGDRCLEELKLESLTLDDDPTPLLRSIGFTARRSRDDPGGGGESGGDSGGGGERAMRREAERQIDAALRGHPLRRVLFHWVLKHARRRVRDRENLRFERTRLFGRVRRIFMEMGHRLAGEGVLGEPRDVLYLEVGEVIGFVQGTTTCTDLGTLVRVRRAEFDRYAEMPEPADRFQTRGAVSIGNDFAGGEEAVSGADDRISATDELVGIGSCPGIVRGPVRVIRDPRGIEIAPGTIVVAERTDPGWIMVLPAAAGLLVQHGSLLSHSAIVSRELGVPSIVSIAGLTESLRDGQWIEMDGQRGTVRLIETPQETSNP